MAAIGVRLGYFTVVLAGLIGIMGSLLPATAHGGSVPRRSQKGELPPVGIGLQAMRLRQSPVFALDVGPAGPPIVARDGTWWLIGRDGQVVHMAWNDTLHWEVGLGASVAGGATIGEAGLLFIPTMKNSIVAMEPRGVSRWRSRAPWGIDGPLAWVPTQGLVYVSDDQHVQWLAVNARLLQRSKLAARRSAGPVSLRDTVAVGTESGALLLWPSRSKRIELHLEPPVRAILGQSPRAFLAIAGADAHLVVESSVRWQRAGVRAAGVTIAREPDAPNLFVIARQDGEIQWLDEYGSVRATCNAPWSDSLQLTPEIAASSECAWISSGAGELWQCCMDGSVASLQLTDGPLMQPVLDWSSQRLLVGSAEREVWAIPVFTRASGWSARATGKHQQSAPK